MYIKAARRTFMSAGCALLFIPTRLSFISENQSVDHHSKPFRGRMKGTFILSAKVIKIIHCRISTPAQYSMF